MLSRIALLLSMAALGPLIGSFGLDQSAQDRAVKPGNDFYSYANGHWMRTHEIPADRTRWGALDQLTVHYTPESLVGRQVAAVVNFPPRQIGKFMSEVLTLGFPDDGDSVVLVVPDKPVPNGGKLF